MLIYTIGHGGASLEEFLGALGKFSITHLIDVRRSTDCPQAPHFEPSALKTAVSGQGVRYLDLREHLPTGIDEDLAAATRYIQQAAIDPNRTVCLLGSDVNPSNCIRSKELGNALVGGRVRVVHIVNGEPVPQESLVASH
jgi:hypothetical protein